MTRTAVALAALALVACTDRTTDRTPVSPAADGGPVALPECGSPFPGTLRYDRGYPVVEEVTGSTPENLSSGLVEVGATADASGNCYATWATTRAVFDGSETATFYVQADRRWQGNWAGTVLVQRYLSSGPYPPHNGRATVTRY